MEGDFRPSKKQSTTQTSIWMHGSAAQQLTVFLHTSMWFVTNVKTKIKIMLYDHFILTFKHNALPIIAEEKDGKMVPADWLMDYTFQEAEYVGKDGDCIEIGIPIGTFLQIKDDKKFQWGCRHLIRLRTTQRTILSVMVHPINKIDNRI